MFPVYETIQIEIKNNTAFIKLNRPESLNAMNTTMIRDLVDCLKTITLDNTIKIVVIQGNGRAFSSGGDIKEMLQLSGEEQFYSIMEHINELVTTLYSMPKLTIAAIEGAAAGLGFSVALATDYIIADTNSKLAMNFIGIGLIPDGGGHFLLKRRIGEEKAKKLIWDGKVLNTDEALNLELIDEVTDKLSYAVEKRVAEWSSKPLSAMIKTKKIYSELNRQSLLKVLELEKQAQWKMRQTKDHQEGIKAFVEKRKPQFIGE